MAENEKIDGVVYAAQGKANELPVVGNWKILSCL